MNKAFNFKLNVLKVICPLKLGRMNETLSYPTDLKGWTFPVGKVIAFSRGTSGSTAVHLKRFPVGRSTRELEKQLYAFSRSGNVHENLIRFLTSETVNIQGKRFT
jgi:hypothetical protein